MFSRAGFQLKKWNSNEPSVLSNIPEELKETNKSVAISGQNHQFAKTLGIEWDITMDSFGASLSQFHPDDGLTKRTLLSNIAKIDDVLGWMSPAIIMMKILLQHIWETGIDWDDTVPNDLVETWALWKSELPLLTQRIPDVTSQEAAIYRSGNYTGFAMPRTYAGVFYLRSSNQAHDI